MGAHKQRIGRLGEEIASDRLLANGWGILERNFRTRFGELDIIAMVDRLVVFVEVKTAVAGANRGPDKPAHAVDWRKQAQIRRMATQWLSVTELPHPCAGFRFDVIGLTVTQSGDVIEHEHLVGAF